jgi:hypothetical protein
MAKSNAEVFTDHHLAELGFKPTPEGRASIIDALSKSMRIEIGAIGEKAKITLHDESGNKMLTVDQNGNVIDVAIADFVAGLARSRPDMFQPAVPVSPARNPFSEKHRNLTAQAELWHRDPTMAERLESEAEAQAGKGNPFKPGPFWNLTEQMKIENSNPDLAARLQREAGV